ncbi:MAG: sugar ABC transporter permease, partial [Bacilli bacterium]|nr:sugar ABC transporter permease [Bacilli bacterium]
MKKNSNFLAYLVLFVLSFIWLLPIVWVVLTSFRATPGVASATFIPREFTFNNYKTLFFPTGDQAYYIKFGHWLGNTVSIALLNMLFST